MKIIEIIVVVLQIIGVAIVGVVILYLANSLYL